ncbi:MAG: hypothetical protein JSR65_07555 [Proteobacteria bacterium]|nr:hypothetical protein [Pseudomonadota bacterium]
MQLNDRKARGKFFFFPHPQRTVFSSRLREFARSILSPINGRHASPHEFPDIRLDLSRDRSGSKKARTKKRRVVDAPLAWVFRYAQ